MIDKSFQFCFVRIETGFPFEGFTVPEKGYDDIRFEIGNPFVFGRKMTYASRRVGVFILKFFSTGECPRGISTGDRKSTRLNSSHVKISYAVFCLKKKNTSANQASAAM